MKERIDLIIERRLDEVNRATVALESSVGG